MGFRAAKTVFRAPVTISHARETLANAFAAATNALPLPGVRVLIIGLAGELTISILGSPTRVWTGGPLAGVPAPREGRTTRMSNKNPILNVPLSDVMRSEIALPLQHVLKLPTVGCLLNAWRNPKNHRSIEQVFDSPQQARHAVATCAAWLGVQTLASPAAVPAWWNGDQEDVIVSSC
jgi:hypothetical protein